MPDSIYGSLGDTGLGDTFLGDEPFGAGASFDADCAARAGIYYRDFRFDLSSEDAVIWGGVLGVEVRALESNPACRYWVQTGLRSGIALDTDFSDAAWKAHQLAALNKGQSYLESGERVERRQLFAPVLFRAPHQKVRVREKWTPVFEMWPLETGSQRVPKIRETSAGTHLVFGAGPGQVFFYSSSAVRSGQLELKFTLADFDAEDATDACALGDKVFVVNPTGASTSEIFALDLDSGQVAMNYSVRGESRRPRFIESLGAGEDARVLAVYVDETLGTARSRCYDLTFSAPRLLWTSNEAVTRAHVGSETAKRDCLLLGAGSKLFLAGENGSAAPVLQYTFSSEVKALGLDYIGLDSGEVWQRGEVGWSKVRQVAAPAEAVAVWQGGEEGLRATAGGAGVEINAVAEGAWHVERLLQVPAALDPATVEGIIAMDRYSVSLEAQTVTSPAVLDERLLIGTRSSGLLFVYRKSALSAQDGAYQASRDTIQRLQPFTRPAS